MKDSTISDCPVIEMDTRHGEIGNITIIENYEPPLFEVKRIFYIYDVPKGKERGNHAHKALKQLLIALSGSFDVMLDDGSAKQTITLDRPCDGLLIMPGIWITLNNFSPNSACLVLASEKYDETSYIRDYDVFKKYKKL